MTKYLFLFVGCLLASILLGCENSLSDDIQEEDPYLYFDENKITCDHQGLKETAIFINSNIDYNDDRKPSYSLWADYHIKNDSLYVEVEENDKSYDRECMIIISNYLETLSDTLLIIQSKNPNVSSGGSGGSSSGGGSNIGGGGGSSSSNRCAAITKKGTRCKRLASKGSIYCWQHKR